MWPALLNASTSKPAELWKIPGIVSNFESTDLAFEFTLTVCNFELNVLDTTRHIFCGGV